MTQVSPSVIILNMPLLPLAPLLSDLIVSRPETLVKLCSQVCFSQRCSQAARSHFTHYEPGTTVATDVRIWLLGQLFESEETRFLIAVNRCNTL